MAKRKLTDRQRTALRTLIRSLVKRGTPKAEILKRVSLKFSISPESARWYLNGRSSLARPTAKRRAKPARRKGKLATRILNVVKNVTTGVLRKALEAKKLLPQLEAKLKAREKLARAEAKVVQSLRAAEAQAEKLKQKIAKLVSG